MSVYLTQEKRIYHVVSRTSYGPTADELERAARMGVSAYLEEQLNPQSISDSLVEQKVASLDTMRLSSSQLFELYPPPSLAKERGITGQMAMLPRIVIL